MAQFEHALYRWTDTVGECVIIAVCDDATVEPIPGGGVSPMVVSIRATNTSARVVGASWVWSNGSVRTGSIAPGQQPIDVTIQPNRRKSLYALERSIAVHPL